jgi:CxxC motif-containing protein
VTTHDTPRDDTRFTSYLCIGCPLGCRLEVEEDEDHEIVEVRGHSCKKGERFARQEHVDPRRMLTTTVAVRGGTLARLPVRTADTIPKHLVLPVCERLRSVEVTAPVSMGDVVLPDALGSGVDVVASRDLPAAGRR